MRIQGSIRVCNGILAATIVCCVPLFAQVHAAEDKALDDTPRRLLTFDTDFDVAAVKTQDVQLSRHGNSLRLAAGHSVTWPGIELPAPDGHWDLSTSQYLALDLKNLSNESIEVFCRVDDPKSLATQNWLTEKTSIKPGKTAVLRVPLAAAMPKSLESKLFGMRGNPGGWSSGKGIDVSKVVQLVIFQHQPTADHVFEIANVRAVGRRADALPLDTDKFFPMIDRYGQFLHKDWPGKTHSDADLAKRKAQEAADMKAQPGPIRWTQYGGWSGGPKLEATGRFHVEKHRGKWWLVDPDGRLFWSHGADCVRWTTGYTPITDREHYFAELPDRESTFGQFYGRGGWAPHGYYHGKGSYDTYNFTGMNLIRKYGDDWRQQFAELAHRRLRSWGMNTIANWSDHEIYLMRKTPYTANVNVSAKSIEGSEGYWGKFPDVFDPSFQQSVRRGMNSQTNKAVGDPWCLGYFISNELSWGDELSLAVAALTSPPKQAAKIVFIDDLKEKYKTIERLNQQWGTGHASWDTLLQNTTPPDKNKARDDLTAFYTKTAEHYFRVCNQAVKQADPAGLYLGCRFAWANDRAVRAAAKYCDIVSFNRYHRSVADFGLPEGLDKPIIIGEFHFGALDRGMLHTGLIKTASQDERADAYRTYVRGALANPLIVGTHWFQFGEQATTGRGDGENYQIGLLDICDTPYPETIRALRDVGYKMYEYRTKTTTP